jgi:hypothetical protein
MKGHFALLRGSRGTDHKQIEYSRVNRVACPGLISRFVDSEAEFLFVPKGQIQQVADKAENLAHQCEANDILYAWCRFQVAKEG